MINQEVQEATLARLARIEGQVKGLARMVEKGHYCIDLIDQVNAIRRALEQVALLIMKRHVESCVAESLRSPGETDKVEELIRAVDRFIR